MASPIRFASIIVTYRCNAKCHMCNTWQHPSDPKHEIGPEVMEKLPDIPTINVTGGEPFLREDIDDIVGLLKAKSKRVVISTNGYFTDRILRLFEKHPDLGIRVSIEGLPKVNDELRGIRDGFDHGLRTLVELHRRGVSDIGFGITASDRNFEDVVPLYHLSKMMGMEFATAAVHNSFYFHKHDNEVSRQDAAQREFDKLIDEMLAGWKVKDWFRAYFNYGLINYMKGKPRLLPCCMGRDAFFLDPYGEILPCNVLDESMGNLREGTFEDLWQSERAQRVRQQAQNCTKNCWMMGSVAEQIKKNALPIGMWALRRKFARRQDGGCDCCTPAGDR